MRYFLLFCFLLLISWLKAEQRNSKQAPVFIYKEFLDPIFEKLYKLEKSHNTKINIVHIGDSHIQADLLTNQIRKSLQDYFGNGGYGFTFPYRLVGTNGSSIVKYNSDAKWKSRMNIYPISNQVDIGLSGIGFYTSDTNFFLELNVKPEYSFNCLKVFYSTINPQYNVVVEQDNGSAKEDISIGVADDYFIHTIERGEYLTLLANKYNTTIEKIKEINGLKGDLIQAGDYIRIPSNQNIVESSSLNHKSSQKFVESRVYPYFSEHILENPIDNVMIYSKGDFAKHNIDGFVLENDKPGVIYHSIGVNGAKISDFNKYPLFFTQLNILHPDLVIISFGTNEAHNSLSVGAYVRNIKLMCEKIKEANPNTSILIFTPPPSQFKRKDGNSIFDNTLIDKYTDAIVSNAGLKAGVWDFYNRMGGRKGIQDNGKYVHLISKDKIHYTVNGYKVQGEMFTADFMQAFNEYKKRRTN